MDCDDKTDFETEGDSKSDGSSTHGVSADGWKANTGDTTPKKYNFTKIDGQKLCLQSISELTDHSSLFLNDNLVCEL
jgi:hypothetical protein